MVIDRTGKYRDKGGMTAVVEVLSETKTYGFSSSGMPSVWRREDGARYSVSLGDYSNDDRMLTPKAVRVGCREFPEPLDQAPAENVPYFYPDTSNASSKVLTRETYWADTDSDRTRLRRGMVHLKRTNAEQHAKVLIQVSGGQPWEEE